MPSTIPRTTAQDGHDEDVDGDGTDDLLVHFPTEGTGFESGDDTGEGVGTTGDGVPSEGTDDVRIIGNGKKTDE